MPKQIAKAVVGEMLETGRQTVKTAAQVVIGKPETKEFVESLYEKSDQGNGLDELESQKRYKEIQEEIRLETRKRKEKLGKYITGQAEFDEEREKDPESYFDKMEKKNEEARKKKKDVNLQAKKGLGTKEIGGGTSG